MTVQYSVSYYLLEELQFLVFMSIAAEDYCVEFQKQVTEEII